MNPAAPHVLPTTRRPALPSAQIPEMHTRLSSQGLLDDVIPFIEGNYRVKTSRESRAIAGLSRGGEQAIFTGLSHLDRFAWIGSFSGAFVMLPGRTAPTSQGDTGINATMLTANLPQLSASAVRQLRLLCFSCGTDDTLIGSNRAVRKWLKSRQIDFVDVETPRYAHVWRYWRVSPIDFAPRLFQ
jgi:enterochelin esterase-like enzyme